ncbi:MAG: sugar phosphate isomerase/epimerase [Anaerolineae bacterium]|nr:sugar phosphate isomerase/epimerase [Anaerolineae bacterium]
MAFAYPHVLDNNWQAMLEDYRALLAPVRGILAMHGPFFDMAPGSIDQRINQLTSERYQHALQIAAALRVRIVVFHANFLVNIRTADYRRSWQDRNVEFWSELADYAQRHDVVIAVENMWEFDPYIIGDVLRRVDHPNLRACIDVGHAHLFSKTPFDEWLSVMMPYLVHAHINNNPGDNDFHQSLHDGVMDFSQLLPQLRALPNPPSLTLEMDDVSAMAASLDLLELERQS